MRRLALALTVLLSLVSVFPCVVAEGQAVPPQKVSKPFVYSGYTAPEYKGSKVFSAYVPMSDGEKLAVDGYLPTEGPDRSAVPVVLAYT